MASPIITTFDADAYHRFYSLFDRCNKRLVAVMKSQTETPPTSIMDMACGTGLSVSALRANFVQADIVGVDINAELVTSAQASTQDPNIEFRCAEIADTLDEMPDGSLDLIFVKSAYHYFDQQVTLAKLKKAVSEDGMIVIAERTARSAGSYQLPDIASQYWTSFFSQPRIDQRFAAAQEAGLQLAVSCYGEYVDIPASDYLSAAEANQIFGLSALRPDLVREWLDEQRSDPPAAYTVFEEYWLYMCRHPK